MPCRSTIELPTASFVRRSALTSVLVPRGNPGSLGVMDEGQVWKREMIEIALKYDGSSGSALHDMCCVE